MCGIVGILKCATTDIPFTILEDMTADVRHRGPDGEGIELLSRNVNGDWQSCSKNDTAWRVGLGSRRLSIMDLSKAGHMPMAYQGRYWITYNGEVYNFWEIRAELQRLGHIFRSSSDTEVVLAAYAEWGTACFKRFRGMWGMLIIDSRRNEAILCRDRPGIKPLYLWQRPGMLVIVSEIKQLLRVPEFTTHMSMTAVTEYLKTGYEDPCRSFFQNVQVVPAGHWMRISLQTLIPSPPEPYWHPECIQIAVTNAEEAGQLFTEKLRESVLLHLRSDVPVGCALSGGMDSSSIAMLVNEARNGQDYPLHTFSALFPGEKIDEQEYVRAVTNCIRTVPHAITPHPATFLEELKPFLYMHDEPIGSLSVYASYCLARLTRETGIPVTLNGQGGDEILSGYWQSYFFYLRELGRNGHILPLLHHFTGALLAHGNPELLAQIPVMLRRYRARSQPVTTWMRLRRPLMEESVPVLKKMLALDEQTWRVEEIRSMYLPRLLKWDDHNSMAFSVEGRYPFLDHKLIELCLSFDPQILYHSGWTKWPLRLGLRNILPEKIVHRRTQLGFEVPQDKWLCGPLRPALEHWLKQDRLLWEYVERTDVQRLAAQTWQLKGKRSEPGQSLLRLFIFDHWAEVFGIAG